MTGTSKAVTIASKKFSVSICESWWSIIAQQLPGRTDNDVKNYWNTKLKKKLSEMGIDPVTHKPISQILADYENMGGLQKSGSLTRDLKNASSQKFEHYQHQQGGFSSINSHFMTTTTFSPEDSFFNNSSNNSMELLAQLQAIKLVTEASNYSINETITPHCINEGSLSSSPSSSSSTCSTAAQAGFSWRDFLLDDAFLPNDLQEPENMADCSSNDFMSQTQSLIPQNQFFNEATGKENIGVIGGIDFAVQNSGFQTSSSSHGPFVDAMIEQENQISSEFLDILEQPF
ncbi:hypothetical protein HS088_TW12G00899 [Tripterygium wilfordii]|uniref:Uncharacterized protein n=1 Tax=Tripterygium wilfordii TaxID=458696 RepID=A0A7J7D0C4_TRIWF|nr:hypothetical protein HS088_TW12G00899 [Tripterygium wilfordii]